MYDIQGLLVKEEEKEEEKSPVPSRIQSHDRFVVMRCLLELQYFKHNHLALRYRFLKLPTTGRIDIIPAEAAMLTITLQLKK